MRTITIGSGQGGGAVRTRYGKVDQESAGVEVQVRLFTTRVVRHDSEGKRLGATWHAHPTAKLFWGVLLLALTYALFHFGVLG